MDVKRMNTAAIGPRNDFLDFVKGVLIFLVVWGHVITNCRAGDFYENIRVSSCFFLYLYCPKD